MDSCCVYQHIDTIVNTQHGSTQQGRADIFDDLFESEGRLDGLGFLLLPSCDIEHPGVSDLSQHEAGLADTNN